MLNILLNNMEKTLKVKDTIHLSAEELQDIVYGDSSDYKVISSKITDTFRHGNENCAIVQRISDNKY